MKKAKIMTLVFIFSLLFSVPGLFAHQHQENPPLRIGVVDFRSCIEKSHIGQQEQGNLENMRSEMMKTLEEKEQLLSAIVEKLKDPEYLDALSPEARGDLENQYKALSEEMGMMQNQAYHTLNQAQMKMFQSLNDQISKAAEYLARKESYDLILNKEQCFYYQTPYDLTQLVVQELNRHYQTSLNASEEKPAEKVEKKVEVTQPVSKGKK